MSQERKNERILYLLNEKKKRQCKSCFYEFVKEFWSEIIPEIPVWNWHIKYLCDELQLIATNIFDRKEKLHDLLINIPPGTTKSTIVTIMFPAWVWTNDPTLRIISNSYSGELSMEHAVKSRDIILSEKYQKYFPYVEIRKDKGGKQNYDNTKNGARYTTSTGGAITGKHAHIIINDDPQNPKQAESEKFRQMAELHTKTLSSRKVNKSVAVTITVMQRLHTKDVSGYILEKKNEGLKHIKLPAEITENTKPIPAELEKYYVDGLLDVVRLNRRDLRDAKTDLGSRGYNGQFLQNPTVEGGDILKREWFNIISKTDFEALKFRHKPKVHFFLDTAYTDKSENDPTGIHATCEIGGNLYIIHSEKWRKEFPALIKIIPEYVARHGYTQGSTIRIEPKASGKSVIQTLKHTTKLNVTQTPSPSEDKKTRANSVSPSVECGRVFLVEGVWNEAFLEEVCGFPNAPHDEDVDLLCYAIDYHLKAGKIQNGGLQNLLW